MTRAGEGAGDQVLALNCALGWAKVYGTPVELEYHWVAERDFKYVESDPEMMAERTDLILSKMKDADLIRVEHVWGSDVFEYHGFNAMTKEALEGRRLVSPRKWFFPKKPGTNRLHRNDIPFGGQGAQAEWAWADKPSTTNKIVMWDFALNRESVKDYKNPNRDIDWIDIKQKAYELFPEYEFVHLTYRDSFQKAYDEIRDCAFCLGYDGMWHLVARNFGKLFVTFTDNTKHARVQTYPSCSAFRDNQLFVYLEKLANGDHLREEQHRAMSYHQERMRWYEDIKR